MHILTVNFAYAAASADWVTPVIDAIGPKHTVRNFLVNNILCWPPSSSQQHVRAFRKLHKLEDARAAFERNRDACARCDVTVLAIDPARAGRSSHVEAGIAIQAGKKVILFIGGGGGVPRPEVAYAAAHAIVNNTADLLGALDAIAAELECAP
jgi:hypothetical protein